MSIFFSDQRLLKAYRDIYRTTATPSLCFQLLTTAEKRNGVRIRHLMGGQERLFILVSILRRQSGFA
jgi:hypothetical protein